jgi:hypothetical protein
MYYCYFIRDTDYFCADSKLEKFDPKLLSGRPSVSDVQSLHLSRRLNNISGRFAEFEKNPTF